MDISEGWREALPHTTTSHSLLSSPSSRTCRDERTTGWGADAPDPMPRPVPGPIPPKRVQAIRLRYFFRLLFNFSAGAALLDVVAHQLVLEPAAGVVEPAQTQLTALAVAVVHRPVPVLL